MSLSFLNKVTEDTPREIVRSECEKLWGRSPRTAVKLFFFVGDQTYGKKAPNAFVECMRWLHDVHPESFFRVLPLTMGRLEGQSDTLKKMFRKQFKAHEALLETYVTERSRDAFRESWLAHTRSCVHIDPYVDTDTLERMRGFSRKAGYAVDTLLRNVKTDPKTDPKKGLRTDNRSLRRPDPKESPLTFRQRYVWVEP